MNAELGDLAPHVLVGGAILLGLLVGSFLNVCIHRLPRGLSVVRPRSACPRCRGSIPWYDNVPLLSYLWLAARCRRCRVPIPPTYPAVEAANGALYGALMLAFGPHPSTLLLAAFASTVLALMIIDAEHHLLPNALTLPVLALGLAGSVVSPVVDPLAAVIGAALGWGSLWLLSETYRLLRGREGIGVGDFKMLAMGGAFLGWKGALFMVGMGSILGSLVGIPWVLARGQGLRAPLPFGTFLGAAALLDLFGARRIVGSYLGMDW